MPETPTQTRARAIRECREAILMARANLIVRRAIVKERVK
jgi:hypothetical protein